MSDSTEQIIKRFGLEVSDGDVEWVAEMVQRYREADEVTRADIRAFFESDGPDKLQDAHERLAGGARETKKEVDDE